MKFAPVSQKDVCRGYLPAILAILLTGCASGPSDPGASSPELDDLLATTPRPDRDAEVMAIFNSAEIVAPEGLYQTISSELADLRQLFESSFPDLLSIKPELVGNPEYLGIYIADDSIPSFLNGTYDEWTELNDLFGFEVVKSHYAEYESLDAKHLWVLLKTDRRINPYRVGLEYQKLSSVRSTAPYESAADKPNMYFGVFRGKPFFLVREAWGDCPNGCYHSHYFLFRRNSDGYYLADEFTNDFSGDIPNWLLDAKQIILDSRTPDSLFDVPPSLLHLRAKQ